jgi:hypothetical protein
MKTILALLALFAAYKIGEQKATLEQMDFYITIGGQYLKISDTGLSVVPDMNLATSLSYFDAISLKRILKKTKNLDVQLEAVSNTILAQSQMM